MLNWIKNRLKFKYIGRGRAVLFGYDINEDNCPKVIEWVNDELLHPLREACWWVRHRTTSRYHVVYAGLQPGWWDCDSKVMAYNKAMFYFYIEKELGIDPDTNDIRVHHVGDEEYIALYKRWKALEEEAKDIDENFLTTSRINEEEKYNNIFSREEENLNAQWLCCIEFVQKCRGMWC